MGLMDMLSPFATGFLEKRVEQQDAREKQTEAIGGAKIGGGGSKIA